MTNPNTPEIEIVKSFYAGLNQFNIPKIVDLFATDCVRVEFEGSPNAGLYRGQEELKGHIEKARSTWAEGSCEPERLQVFGNKIVVFTYVKVRLKNREDWIEGRTADVFTFRNQKIVEMRTFEKSDEALRWIGV